MSDLSPTVPRPAHVPEAAVFDFDVHRDPALLAEPHERIRELQRVAPRVFWTPRNGGHWIAIGHEEIFEASRDTENFSSVLYPPEMVHQLAALLPPDIGYIPQQRPIGIDPPEHGLYRTPLNPVFSPKAVQARREAIGALANSLIDKVIDNRTCEFITDIAEPLPVQVFLDIMGLPLDRQSRFRDLVHEFLSPTTAPTDIFVRMRKVADAMKDVIVARQTDPRDDLISRLWGTEIDGRPMTLEVMEDFANLLFIAGLDTVINGMGFGVRHLARDQALQARLRADPALIPEAVEELLRRYSFSTTGRRVAHDVELGGWLLKTEDRLTIYLPAANLDPCKFAEPGTFDLDRANKVHVAFGLGPHRCAGSHLARVELHVVYERMLTRLPPFRIDERKPVKFHAGAIIAIDTLPLRWD